MASSADDITSVGIDDATNEVLRRATTLRQEGNALLTQDDLAGACRRYEAGLEALNGSGSIELRTAAVNAELVNLHGNAAHAHLKRGNLASAIEHCSEALTLDPTNVKALYRRGTARVNLSKQAGHQKEVLLALADLEQAHKLEPKNPEVKAQLEPLRAAANNAQRTLKQEAAKTQRTTFKNMFSGKKPLYDEPSKPADAPAIIRNDGSSDHKLVMAARGLRFHYERNEPIVKGIDLEIRAGWCLGLFGMNATGKTTLAKMLTNKLTPVEGCLEYWGGDVAAAEEAQKRAVAANAAASRTFLGVAAVVVALIAVALGITPVRQFAQSQPWCVLLGFCVAVIGLLLIAYYKLLARYQGGAAQKSQPRVLHVTSEVSDRVEIDEKQTIEAAIGGAMADHLSVDERRRYVVAMLSAAGFQMFNQETGKPYGCPEEYIKDGLLYGHLSGGQKHLIFVLSCFAARPDVIVGDELLGGLDAWKQPRVIHMLQQLQKAGAAVLYITTDMNPLRLLANGCGCIHDGRLVELGPAEEVFDFPKHPASKEYINAARGLPGGHVFGGKLAQAHSDLVNDPLLKASWMPPPPLSATEKAVALAAAS
eukprot:TRINITY_DN13867_c0_g3_i1.p1 TRINITY_DN13867_c0_g3~~TRINITY_DN13867_c0_g3_i1.p1  ORF type:complete len:594 (+),score=108.97 TRINITY_DN13867_c0_g3_i1:146-1927(+)